MKHFLGIDWGKKKIGIATADHETRIAFALQTTQNDGRFFDVMHDIVQEKNITDIVVGIPKHKGHGNTGYIAELFIKKLKAQFDIKIHSIDEMFTTKMAKTGRIAAQKNAADDDADAARIILQDWLDN